MNGSRLPLPTEKSSLMEFEMRRRVVSGCPRLYNALIIVISEGERVVVRKGLFARICRCDARAVINLQLY